jgi:hypothetical protein
MFRVYTALFELRLVANTQSAAAELIGGTRLGGDDDK